MKFKNSRFARLMRPFLATAAFASLALGAQAAGYLKLGDIKGESTDNAHKEWINLLSVSQSIARPVVEDSTGTRRRGEVIFGDIVCVKEVDASTPKLMEALSTGGVIPSMTMELTKPSPDGSGRPVPYLQWELKNVRVTSYSVSGATEGGSIPTEQISLNYEEIKVSYDQLEADGTSKGKVEYTWKVEEGTK